MTRVIIVRHCEAEGNIKRLFMGVTDGDITENGKSQLDLLSERFKTIDFDVIYSSPLLRAYKTAQACNKHNNYQIIIDDQLIEINGGIFENQPFADFPKISKNASYQWNLEPWNFEIENGESMKHVYERISNAILKIVKQNPNKTIVVVSHGCAIRNLLCWAKGYKIEQLNEVNWCENTGISIIEFDDLFNPSIVIENDATHLNDDVVTLSKQSWWKKEERDNLIFN